MEVTYVWLLEVWTTEGPTDRLVSRKECLVGESLPAAMGALRGIWNQKLPKPELSTNGKVIMRIRTRGNTSRLAIMTRRELVRAALEEGPSLG